MSKPKQKARIICFSNHKGGVGKSCSTCNIGAGLALEGKKVLLVDFDPQANLSLSLGLKEVDTSVYQVMLGQCSIKDTIFNIYENLDLVPSHLDLAGGETELSSEAGRDVILKEALDEISDQYDYILIDCAPSIGLLTINALTASDQVYIPVQAQYLAVQGVSKLAEIIEKIKRRLNKNLEIGGIFITQFEKRTVLNRAISDAIDERFKDCVLKTKVRKNVALAEAPSKGQDIFRYSPKSHGAEDYKSLCKEILARRKVKN